MIKNILHISTFDSGGAGLAALRLHKSLLIEGINSKMLVAHKSTNLDSVFEAEESSINKYIPPHNPLLRYLKVFQRKLGFGIPTLELYRNKLNNLQKKFPTSFSFPISNYDLSEHPLVKKTDIIHLHWIGNFVDFKSFFYQVKKPIIWTFHDINPLYGGFHYTRLREIYYPYYKDMEDVCYQIKKEAMKSCKTLNVVAISSKMKELISNHEFYYNRPVYTIFNSVNGDDFKCFEKNTIRNYLNLPNDKKLLLFINKNIEDSEKGLKELLSAINIIDSQDIELVCVGDGKMPVETRVPVHRFSAVKDTIWLSQLYSACDVLVLPSFQEALPQTPLESICCGTPVVMTPVSGSDDIINDQNGVCCKDYSIKGIADGIFEVLNRTYNPTIIRNDILRKFNSKKIAEQYINLYNNVIS